MAVSVSKPSYTPKEAAYDIAIAWLSLAYRERTDDLSAYTNKGQNAYCQTPYQKKLVRRQIAKLHNRLLEKSGLDGIALDEECDES